MSNPLREQDIAMQEGVEHPQYETSLLRHDVPTELRRLQLLEEAVDSNTTHVIEGLQIPRSSRCLELGAGAGSIARWLAHRYDNVIATDMDTRFLDNLSEPNLTVEQHDVRHDDFPAASFDLVHARMLLAHLPERDAILAKVAQWLAPEGRLVIEDLALFPLEASPRPEIRTLARAGDSFLAETVGTDQRWPLLLPSLLAEMGFADIGMAVTVQVCNNGAWSEFVRAGIAQLGPALVAANLMTEDQLAAAKKTVDDPLYVDLSYAVVSVWGRRPSPGLSRL